MRLFTLLAITVPGQASAVTLNVGPAGYATISEALLVAVNGDTIEVDAGDYPEALDITVEVTIVGLGGVDNNSLSASGAQSISVDGVTASVTGFTLNPTAARGILVSNGASFTGSDLHISGFTGTGPEEGLALWSNDSEVFLNDVVIDSNAGNDDGGAVQLIDSVAIFTRITVTNNISGADGAIAADYSNLIIDDSYFEGNEALDDGGAIDSDNGTDLQITQSTFIDNTSINSAGAINSQSGGSLTIETSTFENNVAQGDGGAVRVRLQTVAELNGNTFSNNSATGHGGAVDLSDGIRTLLNNVFTGNSAADGGAIYAYQTGELLINGDTFDGNSADSGGAISARDDVSADIQVSNFLSNEALGDAGGAIYSDQVTGSLAVSYTTFIGNLSTDNGGAIASVSNNSNGSITLDANHFSANSADGNGGAVHIDTVEEISVTSNLFCLNSGGGFGGGATIVNSGTGSNLWAGNAVIENTSNDLGGGLHFDAGGVTDVTNNTFAGNSSDDGGHIRVEQTTVNLVNNIFTAAANGDGVTQDTNAGNRDFNLWFDNTNADVGDQLNNNDLGAGSVFADPNFVSYSADGDCLNDNLTLSPGSPAINAGDPTIMDRNGTPSDIGAHGGPNALPEDHDGDGFTAQQDCNDNNAAVNPAAEEICDGLDNNCNGRADGEDATGAVVWYYDGDADGFGNELNERIACYNPGPFVGVADDCDDTDANVNPAATEVCDGVDQNCDGTIDEGVLVPWYSDNDGDGYGDDALVTMACTAATGEVAVGGDCDDANAMTYPDAAEVCDQVDNDCDASIDEDLGQTWFEDADGDGFGIEDSTVEDCNPAVDGYSLESGDCDDTDPEVHEDCAGGGKKAEGCGCATSTSGAPGGILLFVSLLAAWRRRRR